MEQGKIDQGVILMDKDADLIIHVNFVDLKGILPKKFEQENEE